MAFRLFGIGSKKNSSNAQVASSSASNPTSDNDEFQIVERPPVQPPQQPEPAPAYPAAAYPPAYPVSAGAVQSERKTSTHANYLDGVPFVLSANATGNENLDAILARIDGYERKVRSLDWSALDYDFSKEKSVVAQEMTATMKRVHLGP